MFLKPSKVVINDNSSVDENSSNETNFSFKCDKIWAGSQNSFCRTIDGDIYAWGLNNYSQLGFKSTIPESEGPPVIVEWKPTNVTNYFPANIVSITLGSHHALTLDKEGRVYSNGLFQYGRLGHGNLQDDIINPKLIEALSHEKIIQISGCGSTSFAVSSTGKHRTSRHKIIYFFISGKLYSWGMGGYCLGFSGKDEDEPEDVLVPRQVIFSKTSKRIIPTYIMVAAGSQHVAMIGYDDDELKENGN